MVKSPGTFIRPMQVAYHGGLCCSCYDTDLRDICVRSFAIATNNTIALRRGARLFVHRPTNVYAER